MATTSSSSPPLTLANLSGVQDTVNSIASTEYDRLIQQNQGIEDAHSTRKRLSQLNQSENLKTARWFFIVTIFAIVLIISAILIYIRSISPSLIDFIIIIIVSITGIWSFFAITDILRRDPINFNEIVLTPPADAVAPSAIVENKVDSNDSIINVPSNVVPACSFGSCCLQGTIWNGDPSSGNIGCRPA